MNSLGKTIVQGGKKNAQQSAQVVAKQVKEEGLEMLKSARQQAGFPKEVSYDRHEYVQNLAQNYAQEGYNKEAHEKTTQEKLQLLRRRLQEISAEEELKARQAESQKYREWQQSQEEAFGAAKQKQEKPLPIQPSKPKKGLFGGITRAVKEKLSAPETGRSAKN